MRRSRSGPGREASGPPEGALVEPRAFRTASALIFVLATITRLGQALRLPAQVLGGDPSFYHGQANLLAAGHGFADPSVWLFRHRAVATAFHPPLWPMVLSISSFLGGTSVTTHKVVASLVGAGAAVAIGLLGRELAGPRVGLLAATIAAVYPQRWLMDGILYSEGLACGLTALTLLLAYRLRRAPSTKLAAGLGVTLGLAVLVRPEVVLLGVLVVAPITVALRELTATRRLLLLAVAAAATMAVIAPWGIRNATTFARPVPFSTNSDAVVAFANCTSTYYDPTHLGSWDIGCGRTGATTAVGDESEQTAALRDQGLKYLRARPARFLSVVMWARIGRVWDVYRPSENSTSSAVVLGRYPDLVWLGVWVYWLVLGAAAAGAIVQRRRGPTGTLWPLLMPAVVVTVTAVYAYGTLRFRAIAEPSLIVLAAVGFDAGARRLGRRTRRARPMVGTEGPLRADA